MFPLIIDRYSNEFPLKECYFGTDVRTFAVFPRSVVFPVKFMELA